MVSVGTILNVADNSGAKEVRCIKVLGKTFGYPGDLIVVSVRTLLSGRSKVAKGEVFQAVIVRCKKPKLRSCGSWVSFDDNAVVLVKNQGIPVGSRVLGPVAREVRDRGYRRIVSLSMISI